MPDQTSRKSTSQLLASFTEIDYVTTCTAQNKIWDSIFGTLLWMIETVRCTASPTHVWWHMSLSTRGAGTKKEAISRINLSRWVLWGGITSDNVVWWASTNATNKSASIARLRKKYNLSQGGRVGRGNSGGDEDKSDNERHAHCVSQKDCAIGGRRVGWRLSVEQRLHKR